MKYQLVVMARRISADKSELRQFYFPVEMRDGRWMPCGPLVPEPTADHPIDLLGAISDYCEGADADCGPLSDIPAPEGWTMEARLWHPDNYVPPSREVVDEGLERGRKQLREGGADA